MKHWKTTLAAGFVWSSAIGYVGLSEARSTHWRPILDDVAMRADNSSVKWMRTLPGKGCGLSLGETVYGEFNADEGIELEFLMCRNRQGVRFDLTTTSAASEWIRGGPAQRIEARSDETPQVAQPERQEPDGEADASKPSQLDTPHATN